MSNSRFLILFLALSIASCEFNTSVNKNFLTGLFTTGDGLSCEDVYLTIASGKSDRTTFTYGEKFFLNFNDISGFKKENDKVFPGMMLAVTSSSGDTVLQAEDLYAGYTDGIDISPLLLRADLTVASPMHSGQKYVLAVGIWDKKGTGTFTARLDFDLIPNARIMVESNVSYDEIYLFSGASKNVITDNSLISGETIYLLFEGLSGFTEENGNVFPGLRIVAKDEAGTTVLDYADLFEAQTESGIAITDFSEMVSAELSFTGGTADSNIQCEVEIWDKKGNGKVKASTPLSVKQR